MDLFAKIEKNANWRMSQEAKAAGAYPYFHELRSGQDTVVDMEGRRTIMLGSNNYLGLTSHPKVKAAGVAALEKYGSGCSGSRFLNGTLDIHAQLERELADFLHKDAAVTFGTGFQSNLGILGTIASLGDYILCDKENHASIYDGCKLSYAKMVRYEHSDMADLEKRLRAVPETAGALIVTDGVFSMSGDICKLPEIVALAKKYGARVMVDDAHGLGVLGKTGRGTAEYFGLEDEVDILMGTFSKSLASIGGYMAAREDVVEFVRDDMCKGLLGDTWKKHFPFIATIFLVVLANNIVGIIPGCKPGTGTISTTAALAVCSFVYFIVCGVKKKGAGGYVKSLAPAGVAFPLNALVWLIEVFSTILRLITLAVRLFCNLFAGHVVMGTFAILASLFFEPMLEAFSAMTAVQAGASILWVGILLVIYAVEIVVACVQAYVFALLSAVYVQIAESDEE